MGWHRSVLLCRIGSGSNHHSRADDDQHRMPAQSLCDVGYGDPAPQSDDRSTDPDLDDVDHFDHFDHVNDFDYFDHVNDLDDFYDDHGYGNNHDDIDDYHGSLRAV